MFQYPIIYDEYHETNSDVRVLISVYLCPHTLYSSVYFGKYKVHDKVYNKNLSIVNEQNNVWIMPILNKTYSLSNDEVILNYVRKGEVKLLTLKNVVYMFPDSLFANIKKIPLKPSLAEYNINDILKNDKIMYAIEYKSRGTGEYKYTIILPKKNNFDIMSNGFGEYFHQMVDKIRMKGGIVHTCLLNFWESNSKRIQL